VSPLIGVERTARLRCGNACFCAGFRMPAMGDVAAGIRAGVRKPPKNELAVCFARCPAALWGFEGCGLCAVAQPEEEPPYPQRTAFQRCLGTATDASLVRHVDVYVAANPAGRSSGPMTAVVMRALFDLCRVELSKIMLFAASPGHR
jgi:hypothetical protein